MPRPLRIAALGFWHVHAGDYSASAQAHPDTELVAVWDDDAERGRDGAERFGVEYSADLDALLDRDDIDGVTITTSTAAHRDVIVRAARAGKHIFTEKLLAPTVAECEEIVAACDAAGVQLMVSLPRLHHGSTLAIRRELDAERIGRVVSARVRLSHDGAVVPWLPERFFDPETAIGGALTDLGCHPVYLVQLFLGARPDAVDAIYRSVTRRAVEDHAVVTVGYPDQAIGVIEAGFVSATPFTIDVFGTAGTLSYSDRDRRLVASGAAYGEDATELEIPADGPDPFARWVEAIRTGTRTDDTVQRAVELTRLVVAANRAAAEGRTVDIDGVPHPSPRTTGAQHVL